MKELGWLARLLLCIAAFVAAAPREASAQPLSRREIAREPREMMERNYAADGPGAVVLVARGDRVLFRAARGEANVETHAPLRPDSVFRIGSLTKQFTAAGLLTLVEAGRVRLDDPLSRYLPEYPGGDRITILELLNHTSGVRNFNGLPGYLEDTVLRDMNTAELIDLFSRESLDFEPGTNWAYSNSGYVLVGAVIEAVTGMPWHVYLQRTFFTPLRMTHTGYALEPRLAAMQAPGYTYDNDTLIPMRAMSMTQPHAAGALVSNADDLLKWNRALHEGRVLRTATYQRMIAPEGAAARARIPYGLGLFEDSVRDRPVLSHGGRIFGFISELSYMPGADITVVILENDDAHNGPQAADKLARRLTALALGEPYPNLIASAVDAEALSGAEGVYRFDGEVTRTLRVVDGHLTAQRDNGRRAELTPIGADDFLYPDGFNRLRLERDASGAVVRARYYANGDGAGDVGLRSTEPPPPAPVGLQLPRAVLDRLAGRYAHSQLSVTIFVDGETLKAQIEGQPPVILRASSPTQFAVEEDDATLKFAIGDARATDVTIRQRGSEIVLRRTQ